jgi:hypothetical protein
VIALPVLLATSAQKPVYLLQTVSAIQVIIALEGLGPPNLIVTIPCKLLRADYVPWDPTVLRDPLHPSHALSARIIASLE